MLKIERKTKERGNVRNLKSYDDLCNVHSPRLLAEAIPQNYAFYPMNKKIILLVSVLAVAGGVSAYFFLRKRSFTNRLIRIAKKEYVKWKGVSELSSSVSTLLIKYWQSVGMFFSSSQIQSAEVQNNYPWSSAFISWLFDQAGAKEKFPYSQAHSGYFQKAKQQRNNPKAALRGFRLHEYVPKPGDLIVYTRQSGANYDTNGYFPSHGELVIEKGNGFIKAIGGNVSNTVKISRYSTDQNGRLTTKEKPFFMVIQNNIR